MPAEVEVPLGGGKVALIDGVDRDLIEEYRWEVLSKPWTDYAVARRLADGTRLRPCQGCGTPLRKNPSGRWPRFCGACRVSKSHRHRLGPWYGVIPMHLLIVTSGFGSQVHHYNGNGLDNRRQNLVILDHDTHRRIHTAAKAGKEIAPSGHLTPLGIERQGYPVPRASQPTLPKKESSSSCTSCLILVVTAVVALILLAYVLSLFK